MSTASPSTLLDQACLRATFGSFTTGITIVTAASADPVGMAVNSFTSVSLDPPLVAFCAATKSGTGNAIVAAGAFCVNVLAGDQEELCRRFATPGADRFRDIIWDRTSLGAPRLGGVLAWIDCEVEVVHPAGDHLIIVGAVRSLAIERDSEPLVFFGGQYRLLGE